MNQNTEPVGSEIQTQMTKIGKRNTQWTNVFRIWLARLITTFLISGFVVLFGWELLDHILMQMKKVKEFLICKRRARWVGCYCACWPGKSLAGLFCFGSLAALASPFMRCVKVHSMTRLPLSTEVKPCSGDAILSMLEWLCKMASEVMCCGHNKHLIFQCFLEKKHRNLPEWFVCALMQSSI